MPFKPTERQKQAIEGAGALLVSAAAGSGKTAVLVERILRSTPIVCWWSLSPRRRQARCDCA